MIVRRVLALALLLGGGPMLLGGIGPMLYAQAIPTASRVGDLQLGVGYSSAKPDYSQQTFTGLAAYADFDFLPYLGVEAEFHKVDTPASDQSYQMTGEVGARAFHAFGRVVPYAKGMIGRGNFNYPYSLTDLNYTLYAGGAGADFKVAERLRLRAEYEVQSWSSFPNGGLTPKLLTFGIAYHFANKPSYK